MAKSNYQFAKRQKELARQKKKEEKRKRKMEDKLAVADNEKRPNDESEAALESIPDDALDVSAETRTPIE